MVAFSVILTVGGLLVLDWGASYLAFPRPTMEQLPQEHYFEFDPMLMWRLRPGFREGQIAISQDGFREPGPSGSKRRLVFVVGGSTVFGLHARGDETVSHYLQQVLGDDYEVVNAGVTGYYSGQELLWIQKQLVSYQPARVIGLSGRNDTFYSLHPQYRADRIPYHGAIRSKVGALDPYYTRVEREPRLHLMRLLSRAWESVEPNWAREWKQKGLRSHPEAIAGFIRNQRAIHALLTGLGIRYDLALQPTMTYPARRVIPQETAEAPPYLDALNEGYQQLSATARKEFPNWYHGVMGLPDSTEAPLFKDDVHFTAAGSRAAARWLYREVFGGKVAVSELDVGDLTRAVYLDSGWHEPEEGFRWTMGRAGVVLASPQGDSRLCVEGRAGEVDTVVKLTIDEEALGTWHVRAREELQIDVVVPARFGGQTVTVSAEVSPPFIPRQLALNDDGRTLGIRVRRIGFRRAGGGQ